MAAFELVTTSSDSELDSELDSDPADVSAVLVSLAAGLALTVADASGLGTSELGAAVASGAADPMLATEVGVAAALVLALEADAFGACAAAEEPDA